MNLFILGFRCVVWVGIVVNCVIALLGLFATASLLSWLALKPASPILWPRFASLLLILLSLFYIPAAVDPRQYRASAWLAVLARFAGVVFFFSQEGHYILFGVFDLVFGVPQGVFLLLAWRLERQQTSTLLSTAGE